MKVFFLRSAFFILLVFLQISFFGIIFPWFHAPLFLIGVVVAMTLVRSFPDVLFIVLPVTLLFDVASSGTITWFSVFAILTSYVTSFLLRRLMIDHRGMGLVLYALESYGATLLYQGVFFALLYRQTIVDHTVMISNLPSVDSLLFALVSFIPVFFLTYVIVRRFEDFIEVLNQKQFRGIR